MNKTLISIRFSDQKGNIYETISPQTNTFHMAECSHILDWILLPQMLLKDAKRIMTMIKKYHWYVVRDIRLAQECQVLTLIPIFSPKNWGEPSRLLKLKIKAWTSKLVSLEVHD